MIEREIVRDGERVIESDSDGERVIARERDSDGESVIERERERER